MNITYRVDKDILYIAVEGRIDASNAAAAEEKIFSIKKENPGKHTVLDADKLEYISSAGLRVILKLRKEEPKLAIINVASDVYEVFDMTGFTDMVTVEKAYPRMSVDGCEFIAKGANGAVYRYDAETIIKTYFAKDALPEIKQERENARRAFILGINTAIPYGIVRVGENYGTITELLNATSVTKLIRQNTEDMTLAAKYYIDMLKSIHAIKVEDGEVPDMKETALAWADFVAAHLPEDQAKQMLDLWLEFEAGESAEARFAKVMDNIQPIMLNAATDGRAWKEHEVKLSKIIKRNKKTPENPAWQSLLNYRRDSMVALYSVRR